MVLHRLKTANPQLNVDKCTLEVTESLEGHKMDAAGINTTRDKVRAIMKTAPPTSRQNSQAFLELLAFYD